MNDVSDIVEGMDLCSVPLLGIALHVLAAAAARRAPDYANAMGYSAIAVLLIVGGIGIYEVGLWNFRSVIGVATLAWLSASSAALFALLIVPPAKWMFVNWREAIQAHRREVKKWRERAAARRALAALPPPPPPVPVPPPVPMEELIEIARAEARRRIALIEATAELEPEDREARKNEELDRLDEELRRIMGSAG